MTDILIQILATLGTGTIVGSVVAFVLDMHKNKEEKRTEILFRRYGAILIQMVVLLKPSEISKVQNLNRNLTSIKAVKEELYIEFINCHFFSSKNFLKHFGSFILEPSHQKMIQVINEMRGDLGWKKINFDKRAIFQIENILNTLED